MRVRWLGWAGVELETEGERVLIDALDDAHAVFAPYGDRVRGMRAPDVVAPRPGAIAGMVTHLHRDHADAAALSGALATGAPLLEPPRSDAGNPSDLALVQADGELAAAGLERRATAPGESVTAGPFTLTALPAVDGTGDPQVSWLVEAGGRRVLHLGDTMFHGWWWRIAERYGSPDVVLAPINGARLTFPHRRPPSPLPGVMDPEQAALATELLGAERVVPIHFGGYELAGIYEPVADPLERLAAASDRATVLSPGEALELG